MNATEKAAIVFVNAANLNGGDSAIIHAMEIILADENLLGSLIAIQDNNPAVAEKYHHRGVYREHPFTLRVTGRNGRVQSFKKYGNLLRHHVVYALFALRLKPLAMLIAHPATRQAVDDFSRATITVSAGGTYLIENYEYVTKLMGIGLAQMLGKLTVLFTQSLGPFTSRWGTFWARRVLSNVTCILLRDEKSLTHLRQAGVSTKNVHVVADSVFALADPHQWETRNKNRPMPKNVAVSVRDVALFHPSGTTGHLAYVHAVSGLVAHMVEAHGIEVTFLSTCQGINEYWTDDSKIAQGIVTGLPAAIRTHCKVDSAFYAPEKLQEKLKSFDLLVSTRLHAAIPSLNVATPVLPIVYEFKTAEIWRTFGLQNYPIELDDLTVEGAIAKCNLMLAEWTAYTTALATGVIAARRSARRAGPLIKKALEERHGCSVQR